MKITYRPEIDGLRAIAVISVILYHAEIPILGSEFPGGFIGVDIFFVISGYLITSIIFKELVVTGSFSIKKFYERRIRRILPVLLFVILVCLPFAWRYLVTNSFVDFSKSILFSLGFSSNFYFHNTGLEYGAEDALIKPLLHTWSLSVEEQYYIIFPMVLLIVFKYYRKYLIHILILGFSVSLGLADWGSKTYSSATFYFLHSRMWELLAGSILAYFEVKLDRRSNNKILNLTLPSVGFFLIGYSILFFNDEMFHPSFYTMPAIIGVCLIIWFSIKGEIITKILSTKFLVGIGLISYSLYLWHYPVFAFNRIIELELASLDKKFLLIFGILILSLISYFFIERPARNRKYSFYRVSKYLCTSLIIIFFFSFTIIFNHGFKDRYANKFTKDIFQSAPNILKNLVYANIVGENVRLSSDLKKRNLFLVGDSYAETLSLNLWEIYRDKFNINFSLFPGCQLILNTKRVEAKELGVILNCSIDTQQKRMNFINQTKNSIVIIFSQLPLFLEEENFNNLEYEFPVKKINSYIQNESSSLKTKMDRVKNIKRNYDLTVKKLLENNHNIILVYPMPEVGIHVPKVLMKNFKYGDYQEMFKYNNLFTISKKNYFERTKSSFELLDSLKGDNIYRVYPHKLFCDKVVKNRCITHDNNNIFYRDSHHPSLKGAEMINKLISKEIEKIQAKFK